MTKADHGYLLPIQSVNIDVCGKLQNIWFEAFPANCIGTKRDSRHVALLPLRTLGHISGRGQASEPVLVCSHNKIAAAKLSQFVPGLDRCHVKIRLRWLWMIARLLLRQAVDVWALQSCHHVYIANPYSLFANRDDRFHQESQYISVTGVGVIFDWAFPIRK